jgi:Divergent InlB B-repeat domain/FG-GAP repeat
MLGSVSALQTAPNLSVSDPKALRVRALVPWHALLTAALLSLLLGAALYEGLAGERSTVAPAVRSHTFSQKGLLSLPLAAHGPVSAAMGAANPAYGLSASEGGFAAASPAQHLNLRFGRSGVSLTSGATHLRLSLRAVGYGSSLSALGEVTPLLKANRVLYEHAGLSEWYANGPLGLEQGFTIARAPSRHPAGPLTLSIALSGNAHASLASAGQSITLSRAGGPSLRYSGLTATDARGRVLHSWLSLHAGRLLLRVDARGARYPLRIDPFVQQGEKLTGSGESIPPEAQFGGSVALSSDGNTALIGGSFDGNGAVGAAWVFTRSGSTWTQQGEKLTGTGETGQGQFGDSVALSADGNTALIGGLGDNSGVGAAWVFTRSGSTWTQQGEKLTGNGASGKAVFGSSVALSSDGNTALIGGPSDNSRVGAAWVFTRLGSTWTQQGSKLTGSGASPESVLGESVALSSDGNTALIGGPEDNTQVGAAWVFTRSGSTWTQQGSKLTGSGEIERGKFGARASVALSSDGNTALIGGPGDNKFVGAAWVFTRSGSTWTQQGSKLTGSGESGQSQFGWSAALSSDGNTGLIGGPSDNSAVGAAWVFTRSGSTWTQQGSKLTGGGETGRGIFGISVALSSDGNTALIGAINDNGQVGAAWVFVSGSATHNLTVSVAGSGSGTVTGTGISCPGSCSHGYPEGTMVALTATPAAGSTFTGWSGGGCSGTGACSVTMSADQSVTGTFTTIPTTHTLTVATAGTGSGTVTGTGINCPGTCSHSYTAGTLVSLTPTPAAGSTFAGWGGACAGTGACNVTMSADQSVTVTFTAIPVATRRRSARV